MKNKKNLKALLEKQKKKKNVNTTSGAKEDEDPTLATQTSGKQDTPNEAESPDLPSAGLGSKHRERNDDSSDDELNYKIEVKHEIVEAQTDQSKKQDVVEVPDYMKQKEEKDDGSLANQKNKIKRADGSNIKFGGGRPTFSNRQKAAGIGGEDFQGLDEIDDDGKQKKNQRKPAEGGRNFEHMGSTAVDKNRKEEEKSAEIKPSGQRPRFTGKAKIGGGASTEQTGPNIQYDFGVKYKTTGGPDEAKKGQQDKEKKADDKAGQTEVRKDKRNIHQNKGRFGANNAALDDQDLDEGFQVVRDPNQKRRQQRANRNREDEDFGRKGDGDGNQPVIKRGGAFGNLGGDSD